MLLIALHLVASRVLKQQNSGAPAYFRTVVPDSALQKFATTTVVAHVTVHKLNSADLVPAACIHPNLFCWMCSAVCMLTVHAACHACMA
jgi:hypothetical protein